jgi:hypothetical protein
MQEAASHHTNAVRSLNQMNYGMFKQEMLLLLKCSSTSMQCGSIQECSLVSSAKQCGTPTPTTLHPHKECAWLTGALQSFCSHPTMHAPQSHTPKIDSGVAAHHTALDEKTGQQIGKWWRKKKSSNRGSAVQLYTVMQCGSKNNVECSAILQSFCAEKKMKKRHLQQHGCMKQHTLTKWIST